MKKLPPNIEPCFNWFIEKILEQENQRDSLLALISQMMILLEKATLGELSDEESVEALQLSKVAMHKLDERFVELLKEQGSWEIIKFELGLEGIV